MDQSFCSWLGAGFILGFLTFQIFMQKNFARRFVKPYYKYVLVLRTDIDLSKRDTAEQCAKVTLESYRRATQRTPDFIKQWERNSQPKIVLKLDKDYENEAVTLGKKAENLGLAVAILKYNDKFTVIGIGPGPEELIDKVTGHLKLLG